MRSFKPEIKSINNINKLQITLVLLLVIAIFSIGMVEVKAETKTIMDMSGREIRVPESPERIVALGAGMMRKVAYFQAVNKIVGVEDTEHDQDDFVAPYQLANPQLTDKPSVGPQHGGDAELIAGVDPELILFSGEPAEARDLQQKVDTPVVMFEFGDIYNQRHILYESLELMGEVIDKPGRAQELIDYFDKKISDLNARTENITADKCPDVYAGGMSYRGAHGFNSVRYPFPPFEFINACDVTHDHLDYETMTHVELSRELLLDWNPEIVFVDLGNYHLVQQDWENHREYSVLKAIQAGEVYGLLPYASYHVNFATVLANSYYAGSVIYPEQFSDIEPEKKAAEIYETILGEPVYQEMKDNFGGFGPVDL